MKIKQILGIFMMLMLVLSSVGMVFATNPTSADSTVTLNEDETYIFSTDDFPFSDDDGDTPRSIKIKSLSTVQGASLIYIGNPVAVDDIAYFADIQNNYLRYTPVSEEFGSPYDYFEFTVIDSQGEESTEVYTMLINVNNVEDAPVWTTTPTDVTTAEDTELTLNFGVTDVDSNLASMQFSLVEEFFISDFGTTSTLDPTTMLTSTGAGAATLIWTPTNDDVGEHRVTVSVTDEGGETLESTFSIIVTNVNDAPTITVDDQTTVEDAQFIFSVQAEDVDNDYSDLMIEEFSHGADPIGHTFNENVNIIDNGAGSATINWIPTQADVGEHTFEISFRDGNAYSDMETFTITVDSVNDVPSISVIGAGSVSYLEDQSIEEISFVTASDGDGDVLTYSMEELSCDCLASSFSSATLTDVDGDGHATFFWDAPTNDDVGTHQIRITVSDGIVDVTEDMEIRIRNTNDAPSIANIPTQTAYIDANTGQGVPFSYQVEVEDVDLGLDQYEVLDYTLTGTLPTWTVDGGVDLSIDSNGLITGTPDSNDAGASYNVMVTVEDNDGLTASTTFTLNVESAYGPEIVEDFVVPQQATEDTLFTLDFSATDLDSQGSELVFTLVEDSFTASYGTTSTLDPTMLINSGTGTASLAWTPTNDDVGTHTVTLTVADANGVGMTDSVTFDIEVANVNDAPVPESVVDQDAYENSEFTLSFTVTDPELDTISVESWSVICGSGCSSSSLDLDLGDNLAQVGDTYTITWTPDSDDADDSDVEHSVEMVFTDGTETATLQFIITVGDELSVYEQAIQDLENEYDDYDTDYDDYYDELEKAERDDDQDDIDDINDDLDRLDRKLRDLDDDLDLLVDDIKDDTSLSSNDEDDLLGDLDDLEDDIRRLRDKISDLIKYGTSGSTDGQSATPSSGSSNGPSAASAGSGDDPSDVVINALGELPNDSSASSSEESKTPWEELRGLVWLIAGIVIAFAVLIFLLAVLLAGGKKR